MAEVNTEGVYVFQASWLPGWQWQAHTPERLMQGSAETEEEAFRKAREAQRLFGIAPGGQG